MAEHHDILWAIMKDQRASAAAKCAAVVLLLKFLNQRTSLCNPSFDTIAKSIGRSRRPTIAALGELKKLGWLSWAGTGGGSSANTNNFAFHHPSQGVLQTAPVLSTSPVLPTASRGAADSTEGVLQTAHELSIELSKNQERERTRATLIPDEFRISDEAYGWALRKLGSNEAVERSVSRFCNHYRQIDGSKAKSRDWQAKLRNWIDDDATAGASDKSVHSAIGRLAGRVAAFDQGSVIDALTDVQWDAVLSTYRKLGHWTRHIEYGPAPGQPGCIAPPHLLAKHGIAKEDAA